MVVWSKRGEKKAAVHGPVWEGMPQTSASAEHCAMCVLAQLCAAPGSQGERRGEDRDDAMRSHTDNTGVKRAWANPCLASQGSRPYAGAYRVATARPRAGELEVVWVKGHQTTHSGMTEQEKWEAQGNEAADEHAKQGRLLNETWPEQQSDEWTKEYERHKGYMVHVGKALACWASLPRTQIEWAAQVKAESKSKTEAASGDSGHAWVWTKGFWR